MQFLTTTEDLEQCCDALEENPTLALDTEFERTNTFYPKPGLIQLAGPDEIYLIDPIAIGDLRRFSRLINNPSITWVMHASSEDLTLLHSQFNVLPAKLFDTQVAAAYLGLGFSLSYQALVQDLLAIHVDKDETRSNWLQRPLTEAQIQYAASDVQFLLELHAICSAQLDSSGAGTWMHEDMQEIVKTVALIESSNNWRNLYADISNAWRLSDLGLQMLQALCIWREEEARRRDRPRNWIAKDNELYSIAEKFNDGEQVSTAAITKIGDLPNGFLKKYASQLSELLGDLPSTNEINRKLLNPPIPPKYRDVLKAWRKIVLSKSDELQIAPELLARKKWLVDLIKGFHQSGDLDWQPPLSGWRKDVLQTEFETHLPALNRTSQ